MDSRLKELCARFEVLMQQARAHLADRKQGLVVGNRRALLDASKTRIVAAAKQLDAELDAYKANQSKPS